jgi:hypothetical protein
MLAGRRFRVELTEVQERLAQQTADACRAVWNTGLEQRREYRRRGAWMNYEEQAHELVEAKTEQSWLTEVPGHCLQQTLVDLDKACRKHGTFRVRWRSSRRWCPSFRSPEGSKLVVKQFNRRHARVKLPKLGWVRFRLSRPLDGALIRSASLCREGRHWFVSLLVDDGLTTPPERALPGAAVGWIAVWRWPWPPASATYWTRCSLHRASSGAHCGCNANFPAPRRVRPTVTRRGTRSAQYGLASGVAAKTSALRPHARWRTTTPW